MKHFVNYGYKALLLISIYLFIFGLGIFAFEHPKTKTNAAFDIDVLNHESETALYATIIENNNAALKTRLALIDAATETIDLSIYSIHNDHAKHIIYHALYEAAERGVRVRFLIDGFVEGGMYFDDPGLDFLTMHENIEIKYYNTFALTHPHDVHNRMHDKLLIVDDYYALMSGRNIGDRYFFGETLYDRDVLIYGSDSQVINAMTNYFNAVYHYPLSEVYQNTEDPSIREMLAAAYNTYITDYPINDTIDNLMLDAIQITQALFIHNPLTAIPKHPLVLETLVDIAKDEEDIIIQSPYFVITKDMKRVLDPLMGQALTILTNSATTNTNVVAAGGYLKDRDAIIADATIYEYDGAMLHAKSMVFGDDISVIGSLNMDPRSAYLSTESMLVIVSEPFNHLLRTQMDDMIDDSVLITENSPAIDNASFTRRIAIRITQILFYPFERLL
ncbi:MAG: phospholipase D-like domain-containing protein [Bacillota bacterium]